MGEQILVVDDDQPILRMLERTLRAEGYVVAASADGGGALASLERSVPDLVVLDVAMPGLDGLAVCRRIRAKGLALPVLLLTARDAVSDRVKGLDAGADDYLVKPFAPEELLARIRALLRRGREPSELLAHGDLFLDRVARMARRGTREIPLSAREASLLELLLRNERHVVTREAALTQVWGSPYAGSLNLVDRYISYLRRKLGDPPLIETVLLSVHRVRVHRARERGRTPSSPPHLPAWLVHAPTGIASNSQALTASARGWVVTDLCPRSAGSRVRTKT